MNDVYVGPITGGRSIDLVVKGGAPDGSNLIKTEYNLPDSASQREVQEAIRDATNRRFQGNSYRVGDSDVDARITARTKTEMSYRQNNMSKSDFVKKGSMIGNLDELIENMNDVRRVKNYKADAKPNVDYYLSGRVAVDLGESEAVNFLLAKYFFCQR